MKKSITPEKIPYPCSRCKEPCKPYSNKTCHLYDEYIMSKAKENKRGKQD